MGEWKKTSAYPPRMQQEIRDRKEVQKSLDKAAKPEVQPAEKVLHCVRCGSDKHTTRQHDAEHRRITKAAASISRVPPEQKTVSNLQLDKPWITNKRRRWLKKHPGVPVNQYPHGNVVAEARVIRREN